MKILHLNLSDYSVTGGTGIAMYRLHQAFNRLGHESRILCAVKQLQQEDTVLLRRPLHARAIERLLVKMEEPLGLRDSALVVSARSVRRDPLYVEADVIVLHCIHNGFLSYLGLPWITEKPTALYVHDMWAFTGQCHQSAECDRWKTGCGSCPHLGDLRRDSTRWEWRLKDWAYRHSRLHVVAGSTWTCDAVRQSMLNRFPIEHIPLGLETGIFRPRGSARCRRSLGLPTDKKLLMFSASNSNAIQKGCDLLRDALRGLPDSVKAETALITIGGYAPPPSETDLPIFDFGFVEDDRDKVALYSAADVLLLPSRNETVGLVSLESLACGTPVVAFRVGGTPDAVRHGMTGMLAERGDVVGFRDCIVRLLENDSLRRMMSRQGRNLAEREYSLDVVAPRHLAFYESLLSERIQLPSKAAARGAFA